MSNHNLVKIFIIIILLFNYAINLRNVQPKDYSTVHSNDVQVQNLELLYSFPDENDIVLLSNPIKMDIDEDSNIYISDHYASSIIKYTKRGKFIKEIGGKGKGPGEFMMQSHFCYEDGKLFVVDQGNRRIQILDKDGLYLKSFIVTDIPDAIEVFKNKLYTVSTSPHIIKSKNNLISILNGNGRIIAGMGSYLDMVKNLTILASSALLKIYDNHIYLLFQLYPILRIYSLQGKLIKTIKFEKQNYAKLTPENYEWENFTKANAQIYPFKGLFRAFDVTKEGIFIGLYAPDIIIDHFDLTGNFKRRFKRNFKVEEFYLYDFKVFKRNKNELEFYILNSEDYPKMDVCTAKIN